MTPSEQDRERDQGHGTGGEPGISGAPRPEHDARRAGACQDEVGDQTAAHRAAELDQAGDHLG
jgi:hypothetical protein